MDNAYVKGVNRYVGRRLRELRLQRGITQEALGRALALTFQQVQKYEKGQNAVSAGRLYHLARVLNVSPLYFFEGLDGDIGKAQPEGRSAWLRLAAAIGRIENPDIRKGIRELVLAAEKIEKVVRE
jgi:transcriptional regulator with XRE-family HTH domain